MTNRYIKALFLGILLCVSTSVFAQESLNDFEDKSIPVLNEELRKLRKDIRDSGSSITTAMPTGGIIMWSGTVATIPSGWHLCDGTNGTPDLRNRFIVCADADDSGVAKTTLTGAATQSGASSIGPHSHDIDVGALAWGTVKPCGSNNSGATGTVANGAKNSGTGIGTDTYPAYYALCLIMKT